MTESDSSVPTVDLTDTGSYRHWTRITLRFSDMDRMQHINNLSVGDFFETARVGFREEIHPPLDISTGVGIVIRRIVMEFVGQAHYPGEVTIGTRVMRLGRSSYTLGHGAFQHGRCFATSELVSVYADSRAGKSAPLPESLRKALETYT
jgi:acyl-CoA thioester hydrolase